MDAEDTTVSVCLSRMLRYRLEATSLLTAPNLAMLAEAGASQERFHSPLPLSELFTV